MWAGLGPALSQIFLLQHGPRGRVWGGDLAQVPVGGTRCWGPPQSQGEDALVLDGGEVQS